MLFHSVTEEDVVRRNCLAKSCPYCVRNSLLEDQNHSIVKYVLSDIFQDRLIGKVFSIIWTPCSPDLTPIDFWLWPKLKAIIFSKRHRPLTSVRGLKLAIMHAFRRLQSENFDHVVLSVLRRMSSCFAKNGYRL